MQLEEHFRVFIKKNKMEAYVECVDVTRLKEEEEIDLTIEDWKSFLLKHKVSHGFISSALNQLVKEPINVDYPVLIAEGVEPTPGKDGRIEYFIEYEPTTKRDPTWDFREIMRIPSVEKGTKLATIIEPTPGINGKNVSNLTVKAKPGKPARYRPGKNVKYEENDLSFYAEETGQFSVVGNRLQVQPEFQINESVSMKSGNLNFVGTIVIRGDVPTGFTVKAEGDVKIYGLVEAATIIAGGSIFISEGVNGQGKGSLEAGEDIKIGYINQAKVTAGNNLHVENSILHSDCAVHGDVYSQKGNIIGGSVSAGKTIEVNDAGSKYNPKTDIVFGVNKSVMDKENILQAKKQELEDTLAKLDLLGEKLAEQDTDNPKIRVSLLRQRNAKQNAEKALAEVNEELAELNSQIGDITSSQLIVRNYIYQNVTISFGKYQKSIKHDYHHVKIHLKDNEIEIKQLYK